MSTKILLARLQNSENNKLACFISVLATVESLKKDCDCYLYVSRGQLKLRILKTDTNLCDLQVQFRSIFFDDYKYVAGGGEGHAFFLDDIDKIVAILDEVRKAVI